MYYFNMEYVVVNFTHNFNYSDYYLDPFEEIHHNRRIIAVGSLFIIVIIISVVTNALGLASLVHFRMWLRHEGYLYLVAIFAANIGILLFDSTTFCIRHWNFRHNPPDSSEFMCRFWHFLMTIYFAAGWLSVALLMNIYLREHLVHRRRCGCPIFAAKYCTLFASKIIVGVIFGLVFVLGLPYMGLFGLRDFHYSVGIIKICFADQEFQILMLVEWCLMWVLPFVFFMPVILLVTLCLSREGERFGFSQLDERSVAAEQFRTLAASLSSLTFFSQFVLTISYFLSSGLIDFALHVLSSMIPIALTVSLGFQPILCFMIQSDFRAEVFQKLRSLGCCKRLPDDRSSASDVHRIRMQEIEENPE